MGEWFWFQRLNVVEVQVPREEQSEDKHSKNWIRAPCLTRCNVIVLIDTEEPMCSPVIPGTSNDWWNNQVIWTVDECRQTGGICTSGIHLRQLIYQVKSKHSHYSTNNSASKIPQRLRMAFELRKQIKPYSYKSKDGKWNPNDGCMVTVRLQVCTCLFRQGNQKGTVAAKQTRHRKTEAA